MGGGLCGSIAHSSLPTRGTVFLAFLTVTQGAKNKSSIRVASDLISFYRPQILVFEDASSKNCRRRSAFGP